MTEECGRNVQIREIIFSARLPLPVVLMLLDACINGSLQKSWNIFNLRCLPGQSQAILLPGESENNCDYSKLVENIVTNISSLFGIVFQIQFLNDEGEWITLSENMFESVICFVAQGLLLTSEE